MASKFGGGGIKCTVCDKTSYPAETIMFEKKPYHGDCFRCSIDNKKLNPGSAQVYEDVIYCTHCFQKEGLSQKQRNVQWEKKETSSGDANSGAANKYGGGGNPCKICTKTVYSAETLSFEKELYHPNCFMCTVCAKKLNTSEASSFEGDIVCRKCFAIGGYSQKQTQSAKQGWVPKESSGTAAASKFGGGGTKCEACAKTVYAAETVAFEKLGYHANCFKCHTCDKKMNPSGANKYDDDEAGRLLLCTKCFGDGGYRQKQASVQHKPTTTTPADARFNKFGGGGTKCIRCAKNVYPAELVSFEKESFHSACLTCAECNKKLVPGSAECHRSKEEGVPNGIYCKPCFQTKGLHRPENA